MRASVSSLILVVVLSACGGRSSNSTTGPSPTGNTTFQGTLAGTGGQNGTLRITIQAAVARSLFSLVRVLHAQAVTATGTLTLSGEGGSVTLTGTYDSSTKSVNLSGGGFAFTGTIGEGAVSGTYTGPNSSSGAFSGLDSTTSSVTQYCAPPSDAQIFNLLISASGAVSGVGVPKVCRSPDPSPRYCNVSMSGRANGTSVTFTITGFDYFRGVPTLSTCTGTIQGTSLNVTCRGSATDNPVDSGTLTVCR